MSNANIKAEMHKGRPSWVVGGVIRVYDEVEAQRLAAGDESTPIDMQATDKFRITFDGMRCVLVLVERRAPDSPLRAKQTMDSYAPPAGEETFRDRLHQQQLKELTK